MFYKNSKWVHIPIPLERNPTKQQHSQIFFDIDNDDNDGLLLNNGGRKIVLVVRYIAVNEIPSSSSSRQYNNGTVSETDATTETIDNFYVDDSLGNTGASYHVINTTLCYKDTVLAPGDICPLGATTGQRRDMDYRNSPISRIVALLPYRTPTNGIDYNFLVKRCGFVAETESMKWNAVTTVPWRQLPIDVLYEAEEFLYGNAQTVLDEMYSRIANDPELLRIFMFNIRTGILNKHILYATAKTQRSPVNKIIIK